MKRLILILSVLFLLVQPVGAVEYTAPTAPDEALDLMPSESADFASDLMYVIMEGVRLIQPALADGCAACGMILVIVTVLGILRIVAGGTPAAVDFAGVLSVSALLLSKSASMIDLAADTVTELSEYGKLLLPVMASSLAAQGGVTASAAIYAGTVTFDALLTSGVQKLLVPMVYAIVVIGVAASASAEPLLARLRDQIRWLCTWLLKTVLYIFTGYIGITGVVSGSADAAAIKATKLTFSGMIPVVGGILSDASEAVLVGAGVVKSAVGVYGLVAVTAIWIAPFVRIGVQYLLLKLTASLCSLFDCKAINDLLTNFAAAMGLLLAMTGAGCILLLISVVCFMKGVA